MQLYVIGMVKVNIYEHNKTKQLFLYIPRRKFKALLASNKKSPKFLDIKEEDIKW